MGSIISIIIFVHELYGRQNNKEKCDFCNKASETLKVDSVQYLK